MALRGVGVDICSVPRIAKTFERWGPKFLNRIYHPKEIDRFHEIAARNKQQGFQFLASRWAVKEAFQKATGDPWRMTPKCIYVETCANGSPSIQWEASITPPVARSNTLLSISHEKEYVVAFVAVTAGGDTF